MISGRVNPGRPKSTDIGLPTSAFGVVSDGRRVENQQTLALTAWLRPERRGSTDASTNRPALTYLRSSRSSAKEAVDIERCEPESAGMTITPIPDLATLSDDELKTLIRELTKEENELSYRRRMLHGRIDILRAERTARLKGNDVSEVDVDKLTDG